MNGNGVGPPPPSAAVSDPATALREQFGDRKVDISRKITACVACRKQKIKCHMRDGQAPCTRCKKRGLPCTVNKSLQMILESDVEWKHIMERKLRNLEAAVMRAGIDLPDEDDMEQDEDSPETMAAERSKSVPLPRISQPTDGNTPQNYEIVMDPDSGPAAIPGSVVSPIAMPGLENNRASQDIITRGIVTVQQAQAYLDIYQNRLDHFLYRIIGDRKDLKEVRAASPLLLAAICSVGALHLATPDFERCYQEFVTIAAAQTFSRRNNVDDIRGLVVAAFWLSSISWTCIALAVRIATDIGLHRSIVKCLNGDRNHYLRTRLWYLVYVCDHHFSVAYGRPPLTRQCDAIKACKEFLECEHAVEDDARLISQVQIWGVGGDIYECFGMDVDKPLDPARINQMRQFSMQLDNIRDHWSSRFRENRYVGNYPRKGVNLHSHFLKLYLYSMAFRGIGSSSFKGPDVASDIDSLANKSLIAATSILEAVISDAEIQNHLNGLPTYFDVMIAFAVVFVLKLSTKYANSVPVDTSMVRTLVENVVVVLKSVTANMHSRHLLSSVAKGAETLLEKCWPQNKQRPVPANANVILGQPTFDESIYDMSNDWNGGATLDNFFMGEYDFLSNQDVMNAYQPDLNYAMPPSYGR
ncbi:unnamed protein product [Zymoseptoria tritici ST99CH_3D1]|uniref:Zn(2)-C6 fungal-type domain-containing protein n=1 Tax=Zymoseptoria tritici (strain ST99CH_3D7) TaxID=1276538 RepID=A0A1X7RUC4_ZYMT9|nr:unnamed protein product [Zymoseptoria tritici ST99CH_3D7]SMR54412.1 unnamed protein product [Zymoseptoria tritici ST99CH_3D1]